MHALLCSKTENGYWENEAREHYTRQQLMNACLLCNCVWLGNRRHYYHSKRQGWPDKTAAKHCGKTQRIRITESGAECSAHYWQIMVVGCRCYIVFRRVQYKKRGTRGQTDFWPSIRRTVVLWLCLWIGAAYQTSVWRIEGIHLASADGHCAFSYQTKFVIRANTN